MDKKRTDLRSVLRGLAEEGAGDAGPHIGTKRLIAYRKGTLPAAERDAVQEHLSLCPRCTGLLRELRDFEAASATPSDRAAVGPESLREEAWASLAQRLPGKAPAIRPVASLPRRGRARYFVQAVAAALLLAVAGLSIVVQLERQRVAHLQRRLAEREEALAGVHRTLDETGRRLDDARGRIRDLETRGKDREDALAARVAGLTSDLETLRRRKTQDRLAAASPEIELSLAPRFVLRGEESPGGGFLSGGGAANPVRPQAGRATLALDLADAAAYPEVRLELADRTGKVLWSGRRPVKSFLGEDGTSVTLDGLGPGRYLLRIEGLPPDRNEPLAEYRLDVEPP